ncbi:transmembrane 4 L6 family member 20 [Latimeria chalumnae]|uniref:transmembrane 4 L6 family member 20 n=1 Tax=Latimeria chalumnae TaxID=7897 RepID=UPI0003C181C5|nr:PREDICTED: transmembrane 4 L6 family member 20 [Latimeria chalumnae]|eukprot:XP_005993092.1 PREDICTED: transmembrane 4 L6 family member 20 [Latimeria chalumnae]
MTCCEGVTACNGFTLLSLAILAIAFNLIPLVADFAEDGTLFHNSISCYEWWLPGIVGGGLLVLPVVSMALAARKKGSCNSRTGMLMSAVFCLVSIIGALYCAFVSLYALGQGPIICEKGSENLSTCDFALRNISSFSDLQFDLKWFFEKNCTPPIVRPPPMSNTTGITFSRILENASFEMNADFQKILHLATFVGLSVISLLEILVSVSQIVAGLFGFICGTSKKRRNRLM